MKVKLPQEVRFLLVLVFLLATVASIETLVARWFGNQTLSPLLAVICLGFIASKFTHRYVLFSVLPFCVLSYWMIQDSSLYPLIRSTTVFMGGMIASWASWHKERLDRQIREFEAVLTNLPLPWLLSDPHGNTLRASVAMASLAGKSQDELVGAPHYALLSAPDSVSTQKGAGPRFTRSEFLQIHPFLPHRSTKVFRAAYLPVVVQNDHCLLTILKEL